MTKLSIRPIWMAVVVLLGTLAVAVKLAQAFTTFPPASQPVGYVAQDDVTNFNLTSGNEILFRGQYEKEFWGGNLIAYGMPANGLLNAATQPWLGGGAANQLDIQGANRLIVTLKDDSTKTPIPFAWTSLSASQQTSLSSTDVLDFLRGVRTKEVQQLGGTFRQRASALGDIVHSRPNYVSDGYIPNWTTTTGTTTTNMTLNATTGQNPTVFVGANDGMLHAFDATTGRERWAYVPSMLIPKMKNLSVNPYVHDYFVDGSLSVANILSGAKRVLVGALGAGGKGLYALDITGSTRLAPTDEVTAASNIKWEITPSSTGFANLGYTYSNPIVAKMVGGTDVVIVGNGYNNSGDSQAWLYLINADTGALINAIKAGTSGTAASPNGLSSPVAVDSNGDGMADIVYAGDLNGTMWKFNLATSSATALLTTSPAQPITMTPGVSLHPNGGYMVDFATGAMLTAADATDTATFAAYGIWDGAPVANTVLLTQTLTERCYTSGTAVAATPCASRVRTVTSNQPDWTSGATHHNGWRVALPAKEKVVGDGSFIESGRFYLTSYNPTVSTTIPTFSTLVMGENWLMELDYLTGGAKNSPFLDLSGNHLIDDDDRVKTTVAPSTALVPDMTTDGVAVGKWVAVGVMSQPTLAQLSTLNNTLFNQNPDITLVPVILGTGAGVTGGHFDVDIFYANPSGGAQASATITVGTSGQTSGWPATLGGITVNGDTIVPALTVSDITDGTNNNTNATGNGAILQGLVTGGFTATRSGNVITIKAPVGAQYNGKTITIVAGTSSAGMPGSAPTNGSIVITNVDQDKNNVSIKCGNTYITGAPGDISSLDSSNKPNRLNDLYTKINGKTVNGYTTTCTKGGSPTSSLSCTIAAPPGGAACTTFTPSQSIDMTTTVGLSGGSAGTGWTNYAPALTATAFNNAGVEPNSTGDTCIDTACKYRTHFHQYDDVFDVTGVNMLNPSSTTLNIKLGIASLSQNFKVIVQNQYLNPAVKLHIGDPSYLFNVDFGYISLKNYTTSATLDLATLQTYRRDPNVAWSGSTPPTAAQLALPKPIGSLAFNMPLDALTPKDWWAGSTPDVRVGLHPTVYRCVWQAESDHDGNMYQPVVPPANGAVGPGVAGWSNSTTPTTATGARHNGALVIQLIKDTTPNSALEQNVAGRPEYGWRVKSALFSQYVLMEYATYWHHPNGKCYSDSGWTKTPAADNGTSNLTAQAPGSTDPHIGNLSAGSTGNGTVTSVATTIAGAVTTSVITYTDGSHATVVRTANSDSTGKLDGTVTIVTTFSPSGGGPDVVTTQKILNLDGSLKTGGDELGRVRAVSGRISWRELVAP